MENSQPIEGHQEIWRDSRFRLFIKDGGYICMSTVDHPDSVCMFPEFLWEAVREYAGSRVLHAEPWDREDYEKTMAGVRPRISGRLEGFVGGMLKGQRLKYDADENTPFVDNAGTENASLKFAMPDEVCESNKMVIDGLPERFKL